MHSFGVRVCVLCMYVCMYVCLSALLTHTNLLSLTFELFLTLIGTCRHASFFSLQGHGTSISTTPTTTPSSGSGSGSAAFTNGLLALADGSEAGADMLSLHLLDAQGCPMGLNGEGTPNAVWQVPVRSILEKAHMEEHCLVRATQGLLHCNDVDQDEDRVIVCLLAQTQSQDKTGQHVVITASLSLQTGEFRQLNGSSASNTSKHVSVFGVPRHSIRLGPWPTLPTGTLSTTIASERSERSERHYQGEGEHIAVTAYESSYGEGIGAGTDVFPLQVSGSSLNALDAPVPAKATVTDTEISVSDRDSLISDENGSYVGGGGGGGYGSEPGMSERLRLAEECISTQVIRVLIHTASTNGPPSQQQKQEQKEEEEEEAHALIVVGLTARNRLYCGETLLVAGASSFAINEPLGVLMYITVGTTPALHFVPLEALAKLDMMQGVDGDDQYRPEL